VLAQRLVRRLCPHCRETRLASPAEVEELTSDYMNSFPPGCDAIDRHSLQREWGERFGRHGKLVLHASPGCVECGRTGLAGRAGVHEMMQISRELRRLVQTGARSEEVSRVAMAEGMRTLRQDGIEKVLAGVTTIEEVRAMSNV
jgi:type II secretory ATPase GspE/PulE/Tfp pilus assembly ATPase PilB-like protein